MSPLNKMGEPYTELTEKDLARMRAIPFPSEFMRNAADTIGYAKAHAHDVAPIRRESEVRAPAETMAKAIKRNMKRKVRRG